MSQIKVEETQQTKLLEYANDKQIDVDFNDVTIPARDEIISAHWMVLA